MEAVSRIFSNASSFLSLGEMLASSKLSLGSVIFLVINLKGFFFCKIYYFKSTYTLKLFLESYIYLSINTSLCIMGQCVMF